MSDTNAKRIVNLSDRVVDLAKEHEVIDLLMQNDDDDRPRKAPRLNGHASKDMDTGRVYGPVRMLNGCPLEKQEGARCGIHAINNLLLCERKLDDQTMRNAGCRTVTSKRHVPQEVLDSVQSQTTEWVPQESVKIALQKLGYHVSTRDAHRKVPSEGGSREFVGWILQFPTHYVALKYLPDEQRFAYIDSMASSIKPVIRTIKVRNKKGRVERFKNWVVRDDDGSLMTTSAADGPTVVMISRTAVKDLLHVRKNDAERRRSLFAIAVSREPLKEGQTYFNLT